MYSLVVFLCVLGTLCLLRDFSKREDSLSLGEEINELIPQFPRKAIQFWSNQSLALDAETPTEGRLEEIDRNWDLLMPAGGGLIHIETDEEYVLPPGMPLKSSNESVFWIISVYHQLHCLNGIRSALTQFYFGEVASPGDHSHVEHHEHVYHCLDYLRQIILCHGDTALEGSLDGLYGTSGWGTTHICKDQEAIRNFAEEKWRWAQVNLIRPNAV
ncbi:hypothetical protein AC578_1895 [Pseudocercospora eumusae]|uniref:Oxidase ustYa n=1 Tax=Pseudocercospora eumusae TaxID=321146 RepID=A0A139H3G8_9PEZI|nr:hypothetical protein AC578_1895 [Pseudocercospora eumusae]